MSATVTLPLFPLSIFPVPGQQSGLRIFEPRYRYLFDELESMQKIEFGIPFSANGNLSGLGSVARLLVSGESDCNGCRDVIIQSTDLFLLKEYNPNDESSAYQYPTGTVERIHNWNRWQIQGSAMEDWSRFVALQENYDPARTDAFSVVEILKELRPEAAQVNQIVKDLHSGKHPSGLNEMLRFARLVMEQEVQSKSGFFPN
jgi:hypothetical protein